MREIAPLLAEDGIDLENGVVPDRATLQASIDRAIARRNMMLFTPVRHAREIAVVVLSACIALVLGGRADEAFEELDRLAVPEPADKAHAAVASTIGVALDSLDGALGGRNVDAPDGLARAVTLPDGRFDSKGVAETLLAVGVKGRAFRAHDSIIRTAGSRRLQRGAVHALAATAGAWMRATGDSEADVLAALVRQVSAV